MTPHVWLYLSGTSFSDRAEPVYFCPSQALIAAEEVAPPMTQGRPSSIWPAAAAAMQPMASAPSPTLPHSETSRR